MGTYGSVFVLFWLGEIQPQTCLSLVDLARDLTRRQAARRLAVLSIAGPQTRPPSVEARKGLAALTYDLQDHVSRVAIVREGQGFLASAAASIVTSIRLMVRPQSPHAFFTDLGDALQWLVQESESKRTLTALRVALEQQRQELFGELRALHDAVDAPTGADRGPDGRSSIESRFDAQ